MSPATRLTCDANDLVNAKSHAGQKTNARWATTALCSGSGNVHRSYKKSGKHLRQGDIKV